MALEYNGVEYGWSNIKVSSSFFNGVIEGITKIEFTEKTEHGNVYAMGGLPHSPAPAGKTEFEGTLGYLQSFINQLMASLPAARRYVTRMPPFTLTVSFAGEDGVIVSHQLIAIRAKEVKHSSKVGDLNMEMESPIIIGDIKYLT